MGGRKAWNTTSRVYALTLDLAHLTAYKPTAESIGDMFQLDHRCLPSKFLDLQEWLTVPSATEQTAYHLFHRSARIAKPLPSSQSGRDFLSTPADA